MQKELTTVKNQLATTRDQQDRSETTITELRQKLDDDTKQLADAKAKGMSSEDFTRMTNENNLLKGIVMRQLKVEAGRALARKLVSDELARLEVQSNVLTEQIENLGRPTVPLSDEERALFKDPQATLADATESSSYVATITAFKPKTNSDPAASPGAAPASDASPASASGSDPTNTSGQSAASSDASPQVETNFKPKVSDELRPLALEAKEDLDRGKLKEAEETYSKLIARDPKNPYLLSNQGVVLSRQNKLKSAEVSLKKALAVDDKDAFSLATLGIVYYRMRRFDDALECLTKAVQFDPKKRHRAQTISALPPARRVGPKPPWKKCKRPSISTRNTPTRISTSRSSMPPANRRSRNRRRSTMSWQPRWARHRTSLWRN